MKIRNRDTKLHAIPHFAAGSFAVHIGVHLWFGIICGPVWGSSPVWGSFAVGDHLRRCTVLLSVNPPHHRFEDERLRRCSQVIQISTEEAHKLLCAYVGQKFFVFTNALVIQSHLFFCYLSKFSQVILFGDWANMAVAADIKFQLKYFPLQEITTLLMNACMI